MQEQAGSRALGILQIGRTLRFVWQSAKGWTFASAALTVVQGILALLPLYLMKLLVDAVTAGLAASDKGAVLRHVLFLVGLMGAATLLASLIRSIAGLVGDWQACLITDHVNDALLAKSIEVDLEYYESARYYDTLHRAQREAPSRPLSIVSGLAQIGQNGVSLLAVAGLLFSSHWIIAAALFTACMASTAVRLRYAGKVYRWQLGQTATERQAGYLTWMLTNSSYAKEVRLYGIGPLFIRRLRDVRRELRKGRLAITRRRCLADLVAQALAAAAIYASCAYVAYQAVWGKITLGDLVMYYQAFQRVQGFLQGMLAGLAGLYEDNLFLSNLYEFLDLKRTVVEPVPATPVP